MESPIMREAWKAMVAAGAKIWRNNTGLGYSGRAQRIGPTEFRVWGRPVRYGLCVGSPDLVGYKSIIITQAMVGQRVAVFVGAEAKDPKGSLSPEQERFLGVARADGAVAFSFRSKEEALKHLGVR